MQLKHLFGYKEIKLETTLMILHSQISYNRCKKAVTNIHNYSY